jgi:stage III sporulation protein AA
MIDRLLPRQMADSITDKNSVSELRIRADSNLVIRDCFGKNIIGGYIVKNDDIEKILLNASNGSLYAVNDMLNKGYLIYDGGIRIGITGEGVIEDDKLIGVKNIRFLTVRIPREIKVDINRLSPPEKPLNTLIVSPPGAGKTTLLRALTRYYSELGNNVLLIDERYELAAVKNGKPSLNVGRNTDVISGIPKKIAYEIGVRTMRPDIISTDEIITALMGEKVEPRKEFIHAHAHEVQNLDL